MEKLTAIYCTAIHPTQGNKSGHARGRKLHATVDGKKTVCNMKAEKLSQQEVYHFLGNGKCKICFKSSNPS